MFIDTFLDRHCNSGQIEWPLGPHWLVTAEVGDESKLDVAAELGAGLKTGADEEALLSC